VKWVPQRQENKSFRVYERRAQIKLRVRGKLHGGVLVKGVGKQGEEPGGDTVPRSAKPMGGLRDGFAPTIGKKGRWWEIVVGEKVGKKSLGGAKKN